MKSCGILQHSFRNRMKSMCMFVCAKVWWSKHQMCSLCFTDLLSKSV